MFQNTNRLILSSVLSPQFWGECQPAQDCARWIPLQRAGEALPPKLRGKGCVKFAAPYISPQKARRAPSSRKSKIEGSGSVPRPSSYRVSISNRTLLSPSDFPDQLHGLQHLPGRTVRTLSRARSCAYFPAFLLASSQIARSRSLLDLVSGFISPPPSRSG